MTVKNWRCTFQGFFAQIAVRTRVEVLPYKITYSMLLYLTKNIQHFRHGLMISYRNIVDDIVVIIMGTHEAIESFHFVANRYDIGCAIGVD